MRAFLLLKDYYMVDLRTRNAFETGNDLYMKYVTPSAEEDRRDSQGGSVLQEIGFAADATGVLTESPVPESPVPSMLNRFSRPSSLDGVSKDQSLVPADAQLIQNGDMSMDTTETESKMERLRCMICQTKVTAPCWKCIYCRGKISLLSYAHTEFKS